MSVKNSQNSYKFSFPETALTDGQQKLENEDVFLRDADTKTRSGVKKVDVRCISMLHREGFKATDNSCTRSRFVFSFTPWRLWVDEHRGFTYHVALKVLTLHIGVEYDHFRQKGEGDG